MEHVWIWSYFHIKIHISLILSFYALFKVFSKYYLSKSSVCVCVCMYQYLLSVVCYRIVFKAILLNLLVPPPLFNPQLEWEKSLNSLDIKSQNLPGSKKGKEGRKSQQVRTHCFCLLGSSTTDGPYPSCAGAQSHHDTWGTRSQGTEAEHQVGQLGPGIPA